MWTKRRTGALARALAAGLTAGMLVLHTAPIAMAAPPGGTDPTQAKPKPAALAPRHTGQTTYGAPIQSTILHKRHKRSAQDSTKPKMASRPNPRHSAAGTKAKSTDSKSTDPKSTDSRATDSKAAGDRSLPPDPAYRQPSESAAH